MAVASVAPPGGGTAVPPSGPPKEASGPPNGTAQLVGAIDAIPSENGRTPDRDLLQALLDSTAADLTWLAWLDVSAVVMSREPHSYPQSDVGEFPDAPTRPLLIDRTPNGPWSAWCKAHGIRSCIVVPVLAGRKIVGLLGLASGTAGALRDSEIPQLQLVASMLVHTRRYEAQLAGIRRMFDEVSRTLENALAVDRALRLPPTYREIARSLGESLDTSYCQIAIRDAKGAITVRAAGGHRPPRKGAVAWPLQRLAHCAAALHDRRAVVLRFSQSERANEPERLALFSPTTRVGVILPFFAGPRTQGVLIVGEERSTRGQAMSPERVAILEIAANRIGHIMRMARRLEYERQAERRRQRQLTVERQRLAREVHDEVGQALTGLLVQIRGAQADGQAGPAELAVIEHAARKALDGARALAYGFRQIEHGIGPLEQARSFAETTLRAAHCGLIWTEERADSRVAARTLRQIARVIMESVTNVVRHAKASSTRVKIEYPDGRIRVIIRDDGVGFSPEGIRPTSDGRGLGLVGCSERLALVGGVFDIRRSPKGGTLVLMEAPRR
jgi:signal transduction histidine kinase